MAGEIEIETPQDRHSSFTPEILRKRETILADNISSKIIGLYGLGMSLRDISSHISEMYDVDIWLKVLWDIAVRGCNSLSISTFSGKEISAGVVLAKTTTEEYLPKTRWRGVKR